MITPSLYKTLIHLTWGIGFLFQVYSRGLKKKLARLQSNCNKTWSKILCWTDSIAAHQSHLYRKQSGRNDTKVNVICMFLEEMCQQHKAKAPPHSPTCHHLRWQPGEEWAPTTQLLIFFCLSINCRRLSCHSTLTWTRAQATCSFVCFLKFLMQNNAEYFQNSQSASALLWRGGWQSCWVTALHRAAIWSTKTSKAPQPFKTSGGHSMFWSTICWYLVWPPPPALQQPGAPVSGRTRALSPTATAEPPSASLNSNQAALYDREQPTDQARSSSQG